MNAKDLGAEPAYPVTETKWDSRNYHHTFSTGGLTKREAFAMAAMQGILAGRGGWIEYSDLVEKAFGIADAMLVKAIEDQP